MDNNLDDNRIEQLLSNAPKIRDNRTKEEILARLKADHRLQPEKKRRKFNWIPAAVSAAALLTIGILVSSMMNPNESVMEENSTFKMFSTPDSMSETAPAADESINSNELQIEEVEKFDANGTMSIMESDETLKSSVYPEDVGEGTIFHIGLAGNQANSVPITFVIPKSQIEEDFGEVQPTGLELYEKYADRIDEEALGFPEYHPYKGNFSVDNNTIIHTLPTGHGYDQTAMYENYLGSLQDTFYNYDEIQFNNEDGTIAEFAEIGKVAPLKLLSGQSNRSYYLFTQENGQEYLSPNFYFAADQSKNLEEALFKMKQKPNDIFLPLIPSTVDFEVTKSDNTTIVAFNEPFDIEAMESKKVMQMIEGMLLTAKSFNEQIQFENVIQPQWNGFDFTKPLPIPVGPNNKPFTLK